VEDAGIDLIITSEFFAPLLEPLPVRKVYMEHAGLVQKMLRAKLKKRPAPPETDPQDTAVILYTSGTSGLPKGVCLTHNNLSANAQACIDHARMVPEHTFLGMIPQFHGFGLMGLLIVPVTLGASVVYLPRFNPTQAVEIVREHRVSVLIAIPSMLGAIHRLKSVQAKDLASLELTVAGGEPLPQTLLQGFKERFGIDVLEGYGMTETSPVLTINMPRANRPGSVGRPIPGVEARVADEEDRVLAASEEGEIQIRGPHVTPGYYNKPAETAAAFRPGGWFCTGDIGKIDADGYVWITGRKKEMIIVGGENVFPREVEGVLEDHAAVAEAAVIGQPDAGRGEVVTAYVMLREGKTATEIGLRDHCREHLAGYKVPRAVHIVDDMPRGPTGKVLRRKLREEAQTAR
jgi:long-chain acyl-CoA synthetase